MEYSFNFHCNLTSFYPFLHLFQNSIPYFYNKFVIKKFPIHVKFQNFFSYRFSKNFESMQRFFSAILLDKPENFGSVLFAEVSFFFLLLFFFFLLEFVDLHSVEILLEVSLPLGVSKFKAEASWKVGGPLPSTSKRKRVGNFYFAKQFSVG